MEPGEAESRVRTRFRRTVADTASFHGASLLIHSGSRDVHWNLAAGRAGQDPVEPAQPFFAASIGKTFTATIVAMLVDGRLVTEATLDEMTRWRNLTIGLDYGYGVARIRPIYLRSKYDSWGGLGATNAVMLYNPGNDVHIVSSFNQTASRQRAMRFVFGALRTVSKIDPPA